MSLDFIELINSITSTSMTTSDDAMTLVFHKELSKQQDCSINSGEDKNKTVIQEDSQLTPNYFDKSLIQQQTLSDPANKHAKPIEKVNEHLTNKANKGRGYKSEWTVEFPWLQFDPVQNHVVCVNCVKYSLLSKKLPTRCNSDAFITGFHNWKKAIEKFRIHEHSTFHTDAILGTASNEQGMNLLVKLTAGKQQQQQNAKNAQKILFDALLFLARQGLPIRGKTDKKSNYVNLLNLLAAYNNDLSKFLNRRKAYISHDIQNEMLELCANSILRIISVEARTSGPFGIIVDGCQDGDSEQISICIRYVINDLQIHEEPIEFYSTSKSDAATLTGVIVDVLLRVNLDIKLIIGQSYDGASTMSGQHGGVQALIQEKAPMAAYVHCYAHRS